jgi:hypothetical protein
VRIPRFHIRTLMILQAVAAGLCAVCVVVPEHVLALLVLLFVVFPLLLIGPMIGGFWAARRYRLGRIDPITAGMIGSAVQVPLNVLVIVLFSSFVSRYPTSAPFVLEALIGCSIAMVPLGIVGGLIASFYRVLTPDPPCDNGDAPTSSTNDSEPTDPPATDEVLANILCEITDCPP